MELRDPVRVAEHKAQGKLRGSAEDKTLSARTVNRRIEALQQFSKWLVDNRRAAFDPFKNIVSLNEDEDRRRDLISGGPSARMTDVGPSAEGDADSRLERSGGRAVTRFRRRAGSEE